METQEQVLTIKGAPMAKNGQIAVQNMALNKIKLSKNARISTSSEELDGLMQSIKEVGLLQPIGVVKNGSGYDICYGSRRFLACSKLGLSHIPVIIHESKRAHDIDIKNLTENIQRRNISLSEAGRYMELLKKDGLTNSEIGVRLGVAHSYVTTCLTAYGDVPKEFRNDIEVRLDKNITGKVAPGKISAKVAKDIINAKKSYGLEDSDVTALFKAARGDERFSQDSVTKYAAAIKRGKKDFLDAVKPVSQVHVVFLIQDDHKEALEKKFCDEGPFKSVAHLCRAILKGEKQVKIDII